MSSGPGGYTGEYGLEPDGIVLGKPIAGGIPAAVYGFSAAVADRIATFLETRTPGHSGIGTTLVGLEDPAGADARPCSRPISHEEAFAPLIALAKKLEKGIADVIIKHSAAVARRPCRGARGIHVHAQTARAMAARPRR